MFSRLRTSLRLIFTPTSPVDRAGTLSDLFGIAAGHAPPPREFWLNAVCARPLGCDDKVEQPSLRATHPFGSPAPRHGSAGPMQAFNHRLAINNRLYQSKPQQTGPRPPTAPTSPDSVLAGKHIRWKTRLHQISNAQSSSTPLSLMGRSASNITQYRSRRSLPGRRQRPQRCRHHTDDTITAGRRSTRRVRTTRCFWPKKHTLSTLMAFHAPQDSTRDFAQGTRVERYRRGYL